jgi:hypothetical protein
MVRARSGLLALALLIAFLHSQGAHGGVAAVRNSNSTSGAAAAAMHGLHTGQWIE